LPLVDSEDELPQDVREASRALTRASDADDAGAAARFARAMARWQAQELQRWAYREAQIVRRHQQELAGMATRLRVVEGGRDVGLDERWNAKLAELVTAQGSELPARPQDGDDAYATDPAKRSVSRPR
jgi:acyl-CoA reductase-like NAD-dependent aldehyde dehydrogenase